MNFDNLDKFFADLGDYEQSDPCIGVVLVRPNTGSEVVIKNDDAIDIMSERYSGSDNFRGGYYQPCSQHSWKIFVAEFFPGWTIDSFVV